MLAYNMRLAVKSFKRNPGLTLLMVCAIALGIAACIVTMTLYHAMSGNPIWWKNDRLFAVTMDNWDPNKPFDPAHPGPPPQLTYRDALYLGDSKTPLRHVVMHRDRAVVTGGTAQSHPLPVTTRVTTADFFAMFDVPFLYGGGWSTAADQGPEPVIVLSKEENEALFGGINSVGRTIRWNDHEFRIVGVLNNWNPRPKFYDLNKDPVISPYTGKVVPVETPVSRARPEAAPAAVAPRPAPAPAEETAAPEPQEAEFVSLEEADAEAQGAKAPVETAEPDLEEEVEMDEALDDSTFIEEQEEEDADVTDIIGGDIENEEEG